MTKKRLRGAVAALLLLPVLYAVAIVNAPASSASGRRNDDDRLNRIDQTNSQLEARLNNLEKQLDPVALEKRLVAIETSALVIKSAADKLLNLLVVVIGGIVGNIFINVWKVTNRESSNVEKNSIRPTRDG